MSGPSKSRWGSLLSGAVAGLESRLDTILAEDDQASVKARAADTAAKQEAGETQKLTVEQGLQRTASRSRPNSRLQDRLAKAVTKGSDRPDSRASSEVPSRPESPLVRSTSISADIGRASIDSRVSEMAPETAPDSQNEENNTHDYKVDALPRPSTDSKLTSPPATVVLDQPASFAMPSMPIPSILTPQTSSARQSVDSNPSRPSIDISTPGDLDPPTPRSPATVDAELSSLRKTHEETLNDHREELHSHLERIDALQSKLAYLSQQLATSAKAASSDEEATPVDKKLAEKDAQISALMEEGQKLSKTEMKHMTTIKKMRTRAQETDKEVTMLKERLTRAERSIGEQTEQAKRAEAAEKAAQDKLKIVGKIEKDLELIRSEREEAGLTIGELRRQLTDALSRAEDAEKRVQAGALEAEKRVTASLKEDIENIRIEKKLAEDRGKRDLHDAKEDAARRQEQAKVAELELRSEIANLETKLELLRSRSEEVSSSATGDSQVKLLRQIETLQTQYALASENWQGIESTLTSRVEALEKDRDETAKRESDIRRKARDVNSKARRLEDELDSINDRAKSLEQDLTEQRTSAQKLQTRLTQAESAAQDARMEFEREKKIWEAEFQQKLEEESNKWRMEMPKQTQLQETFLRANSPSTSNRRQTPDPLGTYSRRPVPRSTSAGMENPLSLPDRPFDDRRPSSSRKHSTRTPDMHTLRRQDSYPTSLSAFNDANVSKPPSINMFDNDEGFENGSPHRAINDMVSASTVGAGPSVQLVERMSAAVRRLESEKAMSKEEMARLVAQRDEAREEVVALMREIDEKRAQDQRVEKLEKELTAMDQRYQTTLEMFGEKSERVDELEGDVADLKKIYRDLVETMR